MVMVIILSPWELSTRQKKQRNDNNYNNSTNNIAIHLQEQWTETRLVSRQWSTKTTLASDNNDACQSSRRLSITPEQNLQKIHCFNTHEKREVAFYVTY